jgi:hypothetical protein
MLNQFHKNICKKRAMCSLFVFLWGLLSFADLQAQQFTECFNYEVGSVNQYKTVHNFYTSDFINDELNKKGSNVVWNLHDSEIVYSVGEYNLEIIQANLVNGYNNFIGSNIVFKFFDIFDRFLFQDSSGIELIGELTYPLSKYNDKKKLINYPHGLFECSTDSFTIDSLQNFFGGWITEGKGITQNCFDAVGEIHFSSGSIVYAYRYTRIDTLRYLNEGMPAMKVDMETYWYESNCNLHTPVIFAKGYQGANGYQNYNYIYVLKDYALGLNNELNEETSSFNIKILNDEIQITNTSHLPQSINLIDLTGRIIDMKIIEPYQNNVSISTHQLSNGVYFLKSSNGDSYKISIVH